jgi:glutathione S-transferase
MTRPGAQGAGRDATERGQGDAPLVLYRCRTPTNVLCPCGAVARRLNGLGLEARVERVPYRRAPRPEIEELTGQHRVPVLVDGDEVVHDSRRILQYLDWAYAKPRRSKRPPGKRAPKRRLQWRAWKRSNQRLP